MRRTRWIAATLAGLAIAWPAPARAVPAQAPAAQAATDSALLDPVRSGRKALAIGRRGDDVAALQRSLSAVGLPLTPDGIFGLQTYGAVRRFQSRERLAVDGIVGRQTMAALDRLLGPAPAAPTPLPAPPLPAMAWLSIPPRPAAALGGAALLTATDPLSRAQREARWVAELLAGNVPDELRSLALVAFVAADASGRSRAVEVWVTPDVLMVGRDADRLRVLLGSRAAQEVASAFGALLPTTALVDRIHRAAPIKLTPAPLPPSAAMMGNAYLARHEALLASQLAGAAYGALRAGHKKDVVITRRLFSAPDRVAIYGWHYPNGQAIQPLSLVHVHDYADYSHGIRLVARAARVDGQAIDLAAALRDPVLAPLFSSEGVIDPPRIPQVP